MASSILRKYEFDLSEFFDRENHDVLTGLLACQISDAQVMGLSQCCLKTGALKGGPKASSWRERQKAALPKKIFDRLGLVSLLDMPHRLQSRLWSAVDGTVHRTRLLLDRVERTWLNEVALDLMIGVPGELA